MCSVHKNTHQVVFCNLTNYEHTHICLVDGFNLILGMGRKQFYTWISRIHRHVVINVRAQFWYHLHCEQTSKMIHTHICWDYQGNANKMFVCIALGNNGLPLDYGFLDITQKCISHLFHSFPKIKWIYQEMQLDDDDLWLCDNMGNAVLKS